MRLLYQLLFIKLAVLLVCTATAAPTWQDYGKLPATSLMSMSSDGDTIAFRRHEKDRDTLMVFSLKENKLLRAVDVSEVLPSDITFVSDDKLVIRATERRKLPGFKGWHFISSVYVIDINTGVLKPLLRLGDNIYIGQTNIGSIIGRSTDKTHLFMPALVAQYDSRSFTQSQGPSEKVGFAVMRVDLESPQQPDRISGDHQDAVDYFVGKNDEVVVEERYREHSNRHEILVKKGKKWHHIYDEKVAMRAIAPVGISSDGKFLVVRTYSDKDRRVLLNMSLKDGKLTDSGLNSENHDVRRVIQDINRIVHGVEYAGFTPTYRFYDKNLNERVTQMLARFPGNTVKLISWSDDWKDFLVFVEGSNYPGEYYAFDENLKATFLGASRPEISNEDVNPIATVNVTAEDGTIIPTLLTIPRMKIEEMKNLPAVVMPHGGPRASDAIGFDWIAQALASEGYMVIQPQFRGSDGFGWAHIEAGYGEWGGKMLSDIAAALDFTITKGMVDKNRVCIIGASYGGYAALESGATRADKYRCVASINGIGNMVDLLSKDRSNFGKYHSWVEQLKLYVDLEHASRDKLKAISPYYKAQDFKAPVLLLHGRNDERVEWAQSSDMAAALKKAGKKVTLVKLDDENHYLERSESRLTVLRELVGFINNNMQ